MIQPVLSNNSDDVVQNLLRLHALGFGDADEKSFHFDRIYNAEHQVYYETTEGPIFAPIKWCGAKNNSMAKYFERNKLTSQYYQRAARKSGFQKIEQGHGLYDKMYRDFLNYCNSFEFKYSSAGVPHSDSRARTFWTMQVKARSASYFYPDELPGSESIFEGAKKRVSVNSYERSSKARLACHRSLWVDLPSLQF